MRFRQLFLTFSPGIHDGLGAGELWQWHKKEDGGGGGIRTHETLSRLPVFKTGAFNRSATPPERGNFPAGEMLSAE